MTLPNAVPDGRISDERLAEMLEWCQQRKADKPWYGEGDESPKMVTTCDFMIAVVRELQSLRSSPSCGRGVKVRPLDTAPSGVDVMEPDEVDIHEGAWALIIGTNGKPAGWIDSHALFAHQIYRDQIIRSALEPAEDEPVAWTTQNMLADMLDPTTICGSMWPKEFGQANVPLFTRPISPAPAMVDEGRRPLQAALEMLRHIDDEITRVPTKGDPVTVNNLTYWAGQLRSVLIAALSQGGRP